MFRDAWVTAMERPRAPVVWRLATVLIVLAAVSTIAWKVVRARAVGNRFKVLNITAEPRAEHLRSEMPVASDRVLAAHLSLGDVARLGAGVAAAVPIRRIEGAAFIASVERVTPLSPTQRTRLTNTFQLAAKLQATIDATNDPDTRVDLQRRLDDQVRARLRMIVPKEALGLMSQVDERGGPLAFQLHQDP